jgi:hypothetical protein
LAHAFTFHSVPRYDMRKLGVEVPVELVRGERTARVEAKLDTGSSYCIFEQAIAEALGINVEDGAPAFFSTATGQFKAFGHWMTIAGLGYEVEALVYFVADEWFKHNVLGRQGWIDRFRLCLIEHDGELYVSHYDQ